MDVFTSSLATITLHLREQYEDTIKQNDPTLFKCIVGWNEASTMQSFFNQLSPAEDLKNVNPLAFDITIMTQLVGYIGGHWDSVTEKEKADHIAQAAIAKIHNLVGADTIRIITGQTLIITAFLDGDKIALLPTIPVDMFEHRHSLDGKAYFCTECCKDIDHYYACDSRVNTCALESTKTAEARRDALREDGLLLDFFELVEGLQL